MFPRSASAEFPNDNPVLHAGARWLCAEPCASATPRLPAAPPEPIELVEPIEPTEPVCDDFARLVQAMVQVALNRGATRAAAVLPPLMAGERVSLDGLPSTFGALEFRLTARAWQGVLAGSESDFSACGDAPLDEWAAGLLAELIGTPGLSSELRRELRGRGVAAFGLLAA